MTSTEHTALAGTVLLTRILPVWDLAHGTQTALLLFLFSITVSLYATEYFQNIVFVKEGYAYMKRAS